jgi:amino acid permease
MIYLKQYFWAYLPGIAFIYFFYNISQVNLTKGQIIALAICIPIAIICYIVATYINFKEGIFKRKEDHTLNISKSQREEIIKTYFTK